MYLVLLDFQPFRQFFSRPAILPIKDVNTTSDSNFHLNQPKKAQMTTIVANSQHLRLKDVWDKFDLDVKLMKTLCRLVLSLEDCTVVTWSEDPSSRPAHLVTTFFLASTIQARSTIKLCKLTKANLKIISFSNTRPAWDQTQCSWFRKQECSPLHHGAPSNLLP